jgi:hypothetical protein
MMDGLLTKFYAVSYNVSDWQRAKRFHGETLGLPVAAFMNDQVGWSPGPTSMIPTVTGCRWPGHLRRK